MSEVVEGDGRHATRPSAMLNNMQAILLEDALSSPSLKQLRTWLIGNTPVAAKLRAGWPSTWKIGDKTGSGQRSALYNIAIARPRDDHRPPLLITAYFLGSDASVHDGYAALAEVGRIVAATL